MPYVSDPAMELHKLCCTLRDFAYQGKGSEALAAILDVEEASSDYFMSLGSIASRFARLTSIYGQALDEPMQSLAKDNLVRLQSFMSAQSQRSSWNELCKSVFSAESMGVLMMSASVIRMRAPISVPNDNERQTFLEQIDQALAGLKKFDGPVSGSLYDALRSIRRIIDRFDIYGVDALMDGLLKAFAIHTSGERQTDVPTAERTVRAGAWRTIFCIASLLILVDQPLTALENHYSRLQSVARIIASEQLLIAGPVEDDADTPPRKAILPVTEIGNLRRKRRQKALTKQPD